MRILAIFLLAASCAQAYTPPTRPNDGIPGCYMISEGAWRKDSLANSLTAMSLVPSEIKLLRSKLEGNWAQLQSDSLPMLAVESRDKSGVVRGGPFAYWQRKNPRSDTIYVGQVLPMAGVRLDLVPSGANLQGTLTAFTDSPLPNSPSEVHFPVTLPRIECW